MNALTVYPNLPATVLGTLGVNKKKRDDLSQQVPHDADPFLVWRLAANRLSRPTIPVRCVALIAFLAMQVGVNPTTIGSFVLLGRLVGTFPNAFAVPPYAEERRCEPCWWFGCGEGLVKIVTVMLAAHVAIKLRQACCAFGGLHSACMRCTYSKKSGCDANSVRRESHSLCHKGLAIIRFKSPSQMCHTDSAR
jgi:hypothetical protein